MNSERTSAHSTPRDAVVVCPTEYGGQLEHAADLALALSERLDDRLVERHAAMNAGCGCGVPCTSGTFPIRSSRCERSEPRKERR